jgi:hypothetical protein
LFPGDAAWINCSHTVPAFSVVLFYFTSAYVFCKDIEQALIRAAKMSHTAGRLDEMVPKTF